MSAFSATVNTAAHTEPNSNPVEMLPMMPRFTLERVRQKLETSFPTANAALKVLEDLDIVKEMTG